MEYGKVSLKQGLETFTPRLGATISDGTPAYTFRAGYYADLGALVWLNISLQLSSKAGLSGDLRIKDIPFNFASLGAGASPHALSISVTGAVSFGDQLIAYGIEGGNEIILAALDSNTLANFPGISDADIGNSFMITITGVCVK